MSNVIGFPTLIYLGPLFNEEHLDISKSASVMIETIGVTLKVLFLGNITEKW